MNEYFRPMACIFCGRYTVEVNGRGLCPNPECSGAIAQNPAEVYKIKRQREADSD